MLPIEHVIGLSTALFVIGAVGALTRRNLILILMSIELMLGAVNLAFIGFNRIWAASGEASAVDGHVFVLMVTTVAAAQIAVGLGMLIALVRNRDSLNVEDMSVLKW
jgi:NADH-quinone oxidoreductase subunit K